MLYPQSFIDRLKNHFAVSAIVGRHVSLRRHGREFMGLCPFHKEKTPSFTVNDEKGFYHCFGCGAHGDVIGFIKDFEGVSYRDALTKLAGEAGLEMPRLSPETQAKDKKTKELQEVTEIAARWFTAQLQSSGGHAARDYLSQRGLTSETIARFRIGYAPDHRQALLEALKREGIKDAELLATGLMIRPDNGKEGYSRFRARVMFPIADRFGRVIAFGGRVLPGQAAEGAPKYLNSPETALFHKGHLLYNLHQARKAAQEQGRVFVCEGYMDVIALAQAGIDEAVAPLGTALTESQLQLLWQLCDQPALCLDGDAAGQRAMARASELALPNLLPGKGLKFIRLPKNDDPDSYVARHGSEAFIRLFHESMGLADALWQQTVPEGVAAPEMRAGQEERLMALAERVKNPTIKAHLRAYFRERLWARPAKTGFKSQKSSVEVLVMPHQPAPTDWQRHANQAASKTLLLVLLYPSILQDAQQEERFADLQLDDASLRTLQQAIISFATESSFLSRHALQEELKRDEEIDKTAEQLLAWDVIDFTIFKADRDEDMITKAKHLFKEMINAYLKARISQEREVAERELTAGFNDEANSRLMALNEQLQALERERELYLRETSEAQ